MDIRNAVTIQLARIRELNKHIRHLLPAQAYVPLPNGTKFFVYPRDLSGPSIHVIKRGFFDYENIEVETLLTFLPEEGVFMDVGANVGIFALRAWLQRPNATIYCFEPEPAVFGCLRQTVAANGIRNIKPFELALGASNGDSTLFVHAANSGGHSLKPLTAERNSGNASISVAMTTLDEFVAKNAISRIDVIKADVQDADADFISGGKESLRRFRPVLLLEVNCTDFLRDENTLTHLQQVTGLRYRVFDHRGREFADRQAIMRHCEEKLSRNRLQDNFFFVPEKEAGE